MKDFSLCKELSLKLLKDLGANPFSIGKIGLTTNDLLTNIDLNVSDENDVVSKVPVWYGEARGQDIVCCLLAGLDTDPKKLEFACVIGLKDEQGNFQSDGIIITFHYDWTNEEDFGTMAMKAGDKWLPISLAQRLQLILGFEILSQEGVIWQKSLNIPQELQKYLFEVIEVVD